MKVVLDILDRTHGTFAANDGKRPRILVVDDEQSVCRCEALILESAGYRVDTAIGGEAAWRTLLRCEYDLLVTDYLMPGVSGLALVRQLRIANMVLPVVVVSGTLATLDTAKLTRDPWTRIHAFVPKPFTGAELLAAVASALAAHTADAPSNQLAPSWPRKSPSLIPLFSNSLEQIQSLGSQ